MQAHAAALGAIVLIAGGCGYWAAPQRTSSSSSLGGGGYGLDARLRAAERVALDEEHVTHRFMQELHGDTVGFTWTWTPGGEPVLPWG